jgi:hypothetical protein
MNVDLIRLTNEHGKPVLRIVAGPSKFEFHLKPSNVGGLLESVSSTMAQFFEQSIAAQQGADRPNPVRASQAGLDALKDALEANEPDALIPSVGPNGEVIAGSGKVQIIGRPRVPNRED